MRDALQLATRAIGLCEPNPRVGCVLTRSDGTVIGTGHTQQACAHQGRTGPCCDALAAAGITRVVAALTDPNPLVAGQGFERLRAAGASVEVGLLADEAREINLGFFSRMQRKTPWVRLKVAASLDGKTALDNGASQWITSEPARADGHAWRARAGALLTGIGTVRDDNPRLDVRLAPCPRQPPLVLVDSRLETPPDAQLFLPGRPVWIYAALADAPRAQALTARGAVLHQMPGTGPGTEGKVDLRALMADLARQGVNELHVEAGHKLNGSLLREGLVDELLVYLAPRLIGQGRGMAVFGPLERLADALPLQFLSSTMVGPDLRLIARIQGRSRF
jgi:diaminohydroxyphosphoribosylaminopyrimidine deaminase/5-amino-6-(5-phosphoribosylamino)uracil reductase